MSSVYDFTGAVDEFLASNAEKLTEEPLDAGATLLDIGGNTDDSLRIVPGEDTLSYIHTSPRFTDELREALRLPVSLKDNPAFISAEDGDVVGGDANLGDDSVPVEPEPLSSVIVEREPQETAPEEVIDVSDSMVFDSEDVEHLFDPEDPTGPFQPKDPTGPFQPVDQTGPFQIQDSSVEPSTDMKLPSLAEVAQKMKEVKLKPYQPTWVEKVVSGIEKVARQRNPNLVEEVVSAVYDELSGKVEAGIKYVRKVVTGKKNLKLQLSVVAASGAWKHSSRKQRVFSTWNLDILAAKLPIRIIKWLLQAAPVMLRWFRLPMTLKQFPTWSFWRYSLKHMIRQP